MSARGLLVRIIIGLIALCLGSATVLVVNVALAGQSTNEVLELHLDTLAGPTTSVAGNPPSTTPDSSGNSLTASGYGYQVSGRWGNAVSMQDPGDGLTVPDNSVLRPAQITVMAWVKRTGGPGADKLIVGKPFVYGGCSGESYALLSGANDGIRFAVSLVTGAGSGVTQEFSPEGSPSVPWDGNWHAIAGTYDGTDVSLYEDGQLIGQTNVGNYPIAYDTSHPGLTDLYAGQAASPQNCDESQTRYDGAVDEIRVYNRALSAQEIATLQSASANTPPEVTTYVPPPTTSTGTGTGTGSGTTTTATTTTTGTTTTGTTTTGTTTTGTTTTGTTTTGSTTTGTTTTGTTTTGTTTTGTTTTGTTTTGTTTTSQSTATGSPASSTTGGGSGTPPPVASFQVPSGPSTTFHRIVLNAGGTTGAQKLLWDIGNTGHTSFVTSPSQPVLGLGLMEPGKMPIKLTAVSANGATSTVIHTIEVGGPTIPASVIRQTNPAPAAVTAGAPRFFAGPSFFIGAAQSAQSCSANASETLTFGLAQVEGCFSRTDDLSQVPLLERSIVNDHYASAGLNAVVNGVCNLAAEGKLPQSDCDDARSKLGQGLDVFISHHQVTLNGITIKPIGPASVVVYPQVQRVISSLAQVLWDGVTVYTGPLDWNLASQTVRQTGAGNTDPLTAPPFPPQGSAPLLSFDFSNLDDIADIDLHGAASLSLETVNGQYSSSGEVQATLPDEFNLEGGPPPSGDVKLVATNDGGPVLDHLRLDIPQVDFGEAALTKLSLQYELNGGIDGDNDQETDCSHEEWKATADMFIGGDTSDDSLALLLAPDAGHPGNGIIFCNGAFKHFGATLNFGGPVPAPEIFPDVLVNNIDFDLSTHPTSFYGGLGLKIEPAVTINGAVFGVFATTSDPFTLQAADDPDHVLSGLYGMTFHGTTFAVGGSLDVVVPIVGTMNLAKAYAFYEAPGHFGFNVTESTSLGIYNFDGAITGDFNVPAHDFEVDASADISVKGLKWLLDLGGTLIASEHGAGACVHLGPKSAGVGYTDLYGFEVWIIKGCRPSHFWDDEHWHQVNGPGPRPGERVALRSSQATGQPRAVVPFTVAPGETDKNIKITGVGGAPKVLITGPGGQRLAVPDDLHIYSSGALVGASSDTYDGAYLGVDDGRPGRYTITLLPGSPAIASVHMTHPGYDTNFRAHLTRKGNRFVLHYDARKRGGGQRVTFFEKGNAVLHPIVTSTGGTGTVAFTPAIGIAGERTIVADATVDGVDIAPQTLAHFRFTGTPRAGRVGRITVHRTGTRLTINWRPAAGASRYGVVLRLSNGLTRALKLTTARQVSVRGIPRDLGGRIQVSTEGGLGDWSRPRWASFGRLVAPFTVQQTDQHNQKHSLTHASGGHHRHTA